MCFRGLVERGRAEEKDEKAGGGKRWRRKRRRRRMKKSRRKLSLTEHVPTQHLVKLGWEEQEEGEEDDEEEEEDCMPIGEREREESPTSPKP